MEKNKYVCPEVSVYEMETQNMMAASLTDDAASSKNPVETNGRDENFIDIWGNEF